MGLHSMYDGNEGVLPTACIIQWIHVSQKFM